MKKLMEKLWEYKIPAALGHKFREYLDNISEDATKLTQIMREIEQDIRKNASEDAADELESIIYDISIYDLEDLNGYVDEEEEIETIEAVNMELSNFWDVLDFYSIYMPVAVDYMDQEALNETYASEVLEERDPQDNFSSLEEIVVEGKEEADDNMLEDARGVLAELQEKIWGISI